MLEFDLWEQILFSTMDTNRCPDCQKLLKQLTVRMKSSSLIGNQINHDSHHSHSTNDAYDCKYFFPYRTFLSPFIGAFPTLSIHSFILSGFSHFITSLAVSLCRHTWHQHLISAVTWYLYGILNITLSACYLPARFYLMPLNTSFNVIVFCPVQLLVLAFCS